MKKSELIKIRKMNEKIWDLPRSKKGGKARTRILDSVRGKAANPKRHDSKHKKHKG